MSYLVEEQRLLAARPAPRAAPHLRMTQGRFINVFIDQFISGVTQGRFINVFIGQFISGVTQGRFVE